MLELREKAKILLRTLQTTSTCGLSISVYYVSKLLSISSFHSRDSVAIIFLILVFHRFICWLCDCPIDMRQYRLFNYSVQLWTLAFIEVVCQLNHHLDTPYFLEHYLPLLQTDSQTVLNQKMITPIFLIRDSISTFLRWTTLTLTAVLQVFWNSDLSFSWPP